MSEILETPFERWKAIFEGKMLIDKYNCFAFLNAEKTKVVYTGPNNQYETVTFITEDFDYNTDFEWRVYNPELDKAVERLSKMADPNNLSFQQALECEKVRIYWPEHKNPLIYFKCEAWAVWPTSTLCNFDLAERRGYRIEAVE